MKTYLMYVAAAGLSLLSSAAIAQSGGKAASTEKAAAPSVLTIGDTAPAIKVGGWVKGTPVKEFDPKKIYVVEFWATWCGPCKVSIPHLTDMAKKFKGKVDFTGVSVFESQQNDQDTSYIKTVKDFVASEGDKMDYNVAYDTPTKTMAKSWMEAAAQNGIPTAFIIKDDKIQWIGHPMAMEDSLQQVVDGKFDIKAAKAALAARQAQQAAEMKLQQSLENIAGSKDTFAQKMKALDDLATANPADKAMILSAKIQIGMKTDPAAATKMVEEMGKTDPQYYLTGAESMASDTMTAEQVTTASGFCSKYIAAAKDDMSKLQGWYVLAEIQKTGKDNASAKKSFEQALAIAKASKDPEAAGVVPIIQQQIDQLGK